MWTILICAAKLDRDWLQFNIEVKLGLHNPTRTTRLLMVVAHRVYHALRMQYSGMIVEAQDSSDFHGVHVRAMELACLHVGEMPWT